MLDEDPVTRPIAEADSESFIGGASLPFVVGEGGANMILQIYHKNCMKSKKI